MQCPACNLTLVMAERTGVEIDYCPQCRGTEVSLAGAVRLASVRVWRCLVCEPDYAFDELLWRVRGEYLEMPGLHLTVPQAARLWGLEAVVCDALLSSLVASRFLRQTAGGTFALATSEGRAMAAPRRILPGKNERSRSREGWAVEHDHLS